RVRNVVLARQAELEVSPSRAILHHGPESSSRAELDIFDSPARVSAFSIALDWTEGFRHAALNAISRVKSDNPAALRDQVYQALKGSFYCLKVFVDVGVVEFHRGENQAVGEIVQKLRALVEVCRVVLVAFEDEM